MKNEDDQVKLALGQQQIMKNEDDQVKLALGQQQKQQQQQQQQQQDNEDENSKGNTNEEEKTSTSPAPTEGGTSKGSPAPQQAQPDSSSVPSPAPTGDETSDGNTSEQQSAGPVRFTFVDSFWTDYTSLGGVVASTSSGSTTAQPLPPTVKQEVEPGEGEAILAVVLINRGFADATSIRASLDLPSGFRAIITPENVDSDTALASYNGIVKAGQTFTLYFRVEITEEAQQDREYNGELRIRYFKVAEQDDEDTRSTTLDIPFRLTGKVILSAAANTPSTTNIQGTGSSLSQMVRATPGVVNLLNIEIINNGSAIATGVLVNVLTSSTLSSSGAQSGGDSSGSGVNNNNSAGGTTSVPAQQQLSSSTTPASMVVVGSPTFNIGTIGSKETKEIVPTIFPADSAAGALTTLDIQVSYNDAAGNKKTVDQVLGVQISPKSPQSGLNVLPRSPSTSFGEPESSQPVLTHTSLLTSSTNGTATESDVSMGNTSANSSLSSSPPPTSTTQQPPQSIQIAAGSVQDLSFAITNNNDEGTSIEDVAVTLTSESSDVRILGDSRWDIQSIAPGSQQELTTQVYASTSLIGSPVFFTVTMQYIRNGDELSTESFQLGAIVVGNIRIGADDVTISYIGDTPNLVGNLLNEGNTPAMFTKIELLEPASQGNPPLLQSTISSQFLGDLPVNSPLAFSIPLQINRQNMTQQMTDNGYPISLNITYSDELRNTHELVVNDTISLDPILSRTGQQSESSSQQNGRVNNGFVDAYWADNMATSGNTGNLSNVAGSIASTLPSEREVGPGEGPSFLAVVLSNTAFSDITGIIGYLELPEGFAATDATNTIPTSGLGTSSSNATSNHTATASLNGVVKAGQTYTLFFKVNVLDTAQKGFHEALLRINYFKVPEPEPGTYRVQTITVPFELPGKVILDASSDTSDLIPGEANEAKLTIRNTGSADAYGVIVNINSVGGSIITNEAASAGSNTGENASSNETLTGEQNNQQPEQSSSSSAAVASVGARTFNIGTIPAGGSSEIATTIYPSSSAGGTLQNLDIEIMYNDANGNSRSSPLSLGFRVLPTPPEGGLSVAPSIYTNKLDQERIILASTITGSSINNTADQSASSSNDSSDVTIIAGRPQDLNFNITNNNRSPITDVVVTLVPRSDSLEILGDSKWTLQNLDPGSKARFSTRVFASESLIGSPVSFEVSVQYVSGDQIKSDSFSLGGNVVGEIKISINDLSIREIGDVPNLTGDLLNQGNTKALFTSIEMQEVPAQANQSTLVPTTYTPQYLGDLDDNSPLPFSIPLVVDVNEDNNSSLAAGNYPVSIKVTYSDELRNSHEVVLNSTVSYSPPQQQQENSNQGFLGFGSSTSASTSTTSSATPIVLILIAIGAIALVIILISRRRSKKKKLSRLLGNQESNDEFDPSSDEYLGSSSENKSTRKQ